MGTMMAKRTKTRPRQPVEPALILEHGLSLRHGRGEILIEAGADIDQPNRTVHRMRRVWVPDLLMKNGTISQPHHRAATRYLTAYEVGMLGATDRSGVYIRASGAPAGLADAKLSAAIDYREATQAVGIVATPILSWCVLSHGSLAGYAEVRSWTTDRASGYLLAALDRLAEHYDGAK